MKMKIISLCDTHGMHNELDIPNGDVLVHAGDLTRAGTVDQMIELNKFLGGLPHKYKIIIAGNHDWCLQNDKWAKSIFTNAVYLEDSSITIEGVKFYGSPWTPTFGYWAFMKQRGDEMMAVWDRIPNDTDILITHGPPFKKMDMTRRGELTGCWDLREKVKKVKPKYHIFGHIHENYGIEKDKHTTYINASNLNEYYEVTNIPIMIGLL